MAPIQEGTYTIQRSSDHNYLVVSGGVVGVSTEDAYKWRIEASSDDNFFIADPVSGNYLWDNGTTGYRPNAVQSANSQWTGLSNGACVARFSFHMNSTTNHYHFPAQPRFIIRERASLSTFLTNRTVAARTSGLSPHLPDPATAPAPFPLGLPWWMTAKSIVFWSSSQPQVPLWGRHFFGVVRNEGVGGRGRGEGKAFFLVLEEKCEMVKRQDNK